MDQQTAPARFVPDPERVRFYEEDARRYAASLRAEDYMEATPQATQRKITLESFDLVADARPEVQCFNELLIQYPIAGQRQPGRVVPDNFVVVHPEPLRTLTSFPLDTLAARPFFVLEYVSKHTPRKDYEDNLVRYEQVLRVPYYLTFYPDNEELTCSGWRAGSTSRSTPTTPAGTRSPNWNSKPRSSTAGSASGSAANSCHSRPS
jgi:hypothetical protein